MSYTLIKIINNNKYNNDLKGQVIKFIDERCTDLRFDSDVNEKEKVGEFKGTSINKNQIPYNMEKDIDRLCLSNAIKRFLENSKKENAFDIYFCYLEMFIGDYKNTRRMIELLSEFEENGSGLLMKHRDHYVHSVYVFLIGLAIYESNEIYKKQYKKYYNLTDEKFAAHHFLKYWGLTSLFHDIGYPFELPFEQVASYFEVAGDDRKNRPYVAYRSLDDYIKIDDKTSKKILNLYENKCEYSFSSTNEMFARLLSDKLSSIYDVSFERIKDVLNRKPTEPNSFGHFMDHAYFSSLLLFKKLFEELNYNIDKETLDALTAILMHNSLYKFSIADYKNKNKINIPFKCELHPLAYLLMLCDELQCYDRTAYGRNSKIELHPMDCNFEFYNNIIYATYLFDKNESNKIKKFEKDISEWINSEPNKANEELHKNWDESKPKLKAYADMYTFKNDDKCKFLKDIELIVDLTDIKLVVKKDVVENNTSNKDAYISDSNFINLYNFAVILNGQWSELADWEKANSDGRLEDFILDNERVKRFTDSFELLSLEYKLSNINQAKSFAKYLNEIDCFYTNKPVNNEMVTKFSEKELLIIGPLEHERWLKEHYDMGWTYGELDKNLDKKAQKNERENKRIHPDLIPNFDYGKDELNEDVVLKNYRRLSKEEQDKDTKPMECMLTMLKMFDGLRIYRFK